MERPQIERKEMCRRKQGKMAERSKEPGSRNSSVEISGSRVCAWVRIHSCQKTFWTRWGRAFSRQILSHWNVNWRWQSKAQNKKIATSSVVDNRAVWNSTKKRYPNETCETRMYALVWTQIFSYGWHKPFSRLYLWNANSTQLKKRISYKKVST